MKKSIGAKPTMLTNPVLIIGTYDKDNKPDIMAVAWGGMCNSMPPCIAISVRKSRYTYENLLLNKVFTVNIPSEKYVYEADITGVYSGREYDKFAENNLTAIKCEKINAPIVKEFPIAFACKVIHTIELGTHIQFIGEIIDTIVDEEVLNEKGLPSIEKINPFIFDSAANYYFSIGKGLIAGHNAKLKKEKE